MMKKVGKRKMLAVICVVFLFVGLILVWFHIPYSPVKSDFQKDVGTLISENQVRTDHDVFAKKDFSNLPVAIQRYIQECGYIGSPKMSYLKMEYHNVDFAQGKNGPTLKIDYTQLKYGQQSPMEGKLQAVSFLLMSSMK